MAFSPIINISHSYGVQMNNFNIENSFKLMKIKKWDCVYWAIDLHGTICKSTRQRISNYTFYKGAKKVLQFLSKQKDIKLILFTCSHKDSINRANQWLSKNKIFFKFINENKDIKSNKLSNFEKKIYFNVLLDDKSGFEGNKDWAIVKKELEKKYGVKIK